MHDTDTAHTYRIIRFYYGHPEQRRVVGFGLTLRQAQAHVADEATHGDGWFDGYENEA